MKLVVGLGNPGEIYRKTRHNAGFMVVEALAMHLKQEGSLVKTWAMDTKAHGRVSRAKAGFLLQPYLYMNRSGEVVRQFIDYYLKQLHPQLGGQNFVVVHDDLDIALGESKLVFGSGPKAHNGVNSIREQLGTDQFWYGRVGVDSRFPEERGSESGKEYVLRPMKRTEEAILQEQIDLMVERLVAWFMKEDE